MSFKARRWSRAGLLVAVLVPGCATSGRPPRASAEDQRLQFPSDPYYTHDHAWIRLEQDGRIAVLGLTAFAVMELGDITTIELPMAGERARRQQVIGTVESVKAVSDIYAPLDGKVLKLNDTLHAEPELLSRSCYERGWLLQLELVAPVDQQLLMTAAEYRKFVAAQSASDAAPLDHPVRRKRRSLDR